MLWIFGHGLYVDDVLVGDLPHGQAVWMTRKLVNLIRRSFMVLQQLLSLGLLVIIGRQRVQIIIGVTVRLVWHEGVQT